MEASRLRYDGNLQAGGYAVSCTLFKRGNVKFIIIDCRRIVDGFKNLLLNDVTVEPGLV